MPRFSFALGRISLVSPARSPLRSAKWRPGRDDSLPEDEILGDMRRTASHDAAVLKKEGALAAVESAGVGDDADSV